MTTEWYCKTPANEEFGPFTSADLKQFASEGRITLETSLRKGEVGQWVPASRVKGLFDKQPPKPIHAVPNTSNDGASLASATGFHSPPTPENVTGGNYSAIIVGVSVIAATLVVAFLVLPPARIKPSAQDKLANPQIAPPRPQPTLAEQKANPQKIVNRYPNRSLKSEHFEYLGNDGRQIKHGKESQWYEDGRDKIQGNWVDGQRDGAWIAWHNNGQKQVEGEYRNGSAVGHWSYLSDDGKSIGKRQDGVRVGVWKHWSKDGKTFAVGEYVMGVKNGKWQFYKSVIENALPDSSPTLDVEFQDGIWNGNLTFYNKSGQPEFHAYYQQGKEIPAKRVIYLPKKDQFGFPARERVDANHSLHFMADSVAAPKPDSFEFIAGETGPFEPISMSYEPYREYWSNAGQLRAQGEFRSGPNGKKSFQGKYTKWFSNGKEELSITYNDGMKHGPYTEWYDSGQKKSEGPYLADEPVGKWLFWYASGRKKAEIDLDGRIAKLWEANGDEASVADYKQLVKSLFD